MLHLIKISKLTFSKTILCCNYFSPVIIFLFSTIVWLLVNVDQLFDLDGNSSNYYFQTRIFYCRTLRLPRLIKCDLPLRSAVCQAQTTRVLRWNWLANKQLVGWGAIKERGQVSWSSEPFQPPQDARRWVNSANQMMYSLFSLCSLIYYRTKAFVKCTLKLK